MEISPRARDFAQHLRFSQIVHSLVPRKMEGSMITDEDIAIQRCVKMIKEGKVTSITGKELDIKGDTLCVHGDGPKALAFVQKIREKFTEAIYLLA